MRAIRASREEQARLALRGISIDGVQDELPDDDDNDDDLPEASELRAEDEQLAAVPPVEAHNRYEKPTPAGDKPRPAQSSSSGSAKQAETAVVQLKTLWANEVASSEAENESADIFCVRFSPDGTLIAAGCGDGVVRLLHTDGGRLAYSLSEDSALKLPTTCLRFRPAADSARTRNILLAASSDGTIKQWHSTSQRCMHTINEEGNQVYAIDYVSDGSRFASGGRDCSVRVYDEATKNCVLSLGSSFDRQAVGHSNRIFAVKFDVAQPDVLISAGWDNTVQVWDLRAGHSVRSIWGAHVCGDALDLDGSTVLTGSWRPTEQLQLWDLRSSEIIEEIAWGRSPLGKEPCQLYAAQFSKHGQRDLIAAGGSGSNELKLFSRSSKKAIGSLALERGVYGLDFAPNGKTIAIAAGDSKVRVVAVPQ